MFIKTLVAICLSFSITSIAAAEKTCCSLASSKCTGSAYCKACSNCSGCKYCNSGGKCGACTSKKAPSSEKKPVVEKTSGQCVAITKKRTRCSRTSQPGRSYCWQH